MSNQISANSFEDDNKNISVSQPNDSKQGPKGVIMFENSQANETGNLLEDIPIPA